MAALFGLNRAMAAVQVPCSPGGRSGQFVLLGLNQMRLLEARRNRHQVRSSGRKGSEEGAKEACRGPFKVTEISISLTREK
jgi:hypothetical protein